MKKYILLVLITLLAALLRLSGLDKYPPGVTADEIQQGYSGYSILHTGKDEWGDFLPINPRGFGDYKPALYSYLTVPSEAIFGLNITAVRLPAAVAGVLTVLLTYFLAEEIFGVTAIGLLAALFVSISSWHIQYSRLGWESNVGVLMFSAGLLFFLKGLRKNQYLVLSALFFGLGLFTYHSFKLFILLFGVGLILIYKKKILKMNRKFLVTSMAIFTIFFLLVIQGFLFSGAGRRASDAAIYNEDNLGGLRQIQVEDKLPQPWGRIINNKIMYVGNVFAQNYLGYFSTTFLTSPFRDNSTLFNLPGEWLITLWNFGLVLIGFYIIIRDKPQWSKVVLLWLVLAPVPAALTKEYMHAQRVEDLLPLFPMIAAFTAYYLYTHLRDLRKVFIVGLSLVVAWGFVGRVDSYLFHEFSQDLGGLKYGYQEAVGFSNSHYNQFDHIIFTKENSEPQIFVAFYSQMDPTFYQSYSKDWVSFENNGFKFLDQTNFHLGKYYFKNIEWDKDKEMKNTLIVASPDEVPSNVNPVKSIKNINGKVVFNIYETDLITK